MPVCHAGSVATLATFFLSFFGNRCQALVKNSTLALAADKPRPNIVWVMADDLGWGEPGLYPSNSPHGRIATPNLDKFGREGIVFTHAYAGYTVCAPSRTTFFTGRHSGNFRKAGLNGHAIEPAQHVTLAEILKAAGYRTGAFGKVAPLTSPLEQGFEVFTGQIDQSLCHNMYPKKIDAGSATLNLELVGNDRPKSRELCMSHPETYNYTIDVFHEYGMGWLTEVSKGSDPFFLYLSYTIPHAGGWGDAPEAPEEGAPVPSDFMYADMAWPDVEKDHAAVITYLDMKLGDLMMRLKALKIEENTLVFFASDNGAHREGGHSHTFFNSTGGLQGHKRSLFEGGVRSPTMVRWPNVIKPGRVSNFSWAFWDVVPTLGELAGAEIPQGLDGISILPELHGELQQEHEYLYFTWPGSGSDVGQQLADSVVHLTGNARDLRAVRQQLADSVVHLTGNARDLRNGPSVPSGYAVVMGQWKAIVPHCSGAGLQPSREDAMQLYDLSNDPFEQLDVAHENLDVVAKLKDLVGSKDLSCRCYQCPSHTGQTMLVGVL